MTPPETGWQRALYFARVGAALGNHAKSDRLPAQQDLKNTGPGSDRLLHGGSSK